MQQSILLVLFLYFTAWFIFTSIIKNASLIDIGWGLGFVLVSVLIQLTRFSPEGLVFLVMVSLWGLRLSYHIFKRNVGKPEDFRYAQFRKDWGKGFYLRAYFQLFLLQGALTFVIAQSYISAQSEPVVGSMLLIAFGVLVFVIGYLFESMGDAQLKRHISDPKTKGTIIKSGLWAYTRHPNYFGEVVLWWGIWLTGIGFGAPLWTIIGPLAINYFIRYVSGVPMLEKRLQKYADYETYVKEIPIFIPRIGRKGA